MPVLKTSIDNVAGLKELIEALENRIATLEKELKEVKDKIPKIKVID